MIRPLAAAVAGFSLLGATVASAQVIVQPSEGPATPYAAEPFVAPPSAYPSEGTTTDGFVARDDNYYDRSTRPSGALSGQCSTDEGYGRRGTCESTGQ
jgi:hypothetical protein